MRKSVVCLWLIRKIRNFLFVKQIHSKISTSIFSDNYNIMWKCCKCKEDVLKGEKCPCGHNLCSLCE